MTTQRQAEEQDGGLGPVCRWPDDNGPAKMSVAVTFAVKGDGLAGLYSRRDTYEVFEPLEIDGYPAVTAFAGKTDPRQRFGKCDIDVAVTEQLVFEVQMQFNKGVDKPAEFTNPCPRAQRVAAEVLRTLQGDG